MTVTTLLEDGAVKTSPIAALAWLSPTMLQLLNVEELRSEPPRIDGARRRLDRAVYRALIRWEEVFSFPPTIAELAALLGRSHMRTWDAAQSLIDMGLCERWGKGDRVLRIKARLAV